MPHASKLPALPALTVDHFNKVVCLLIMFLQNSGNSLNNLGL
jgi:hypothetical protein